MPRLRQQPQPDLCQKLAALVAELQAVVVIEVLRALAIYLQLANLTEVIPACRKQLAREEARWNYRPGDRGRLLTRGSHRTGRARLTHPAPRFKNALIPFAISGVALR